MGQISIVTYDSSQHLKPDVCKTKYYNFLNEIERKITEFEKNGQAEFCENCIKIKEFISDKNNELKDCYDSYALPINLNDENTIKDFYYRKCLGKFQCSKDSTPAFNEGAKLEQKTEEVGKDIINNEKHQLQLKDHHDEASECHKNPYHTQILEPTDDSNREEGTESAHGTTLSTLSDQGGQYLKDVSCLNDLETNSKFYCISALPLANITDNALSLFNESEKYASVNKQMYDKNNYYVHYDYDATNNGYDDVTVFTLRNIQNPVYKPNNEVQDTTSKEVDHINVPSHGTFNTNSISLQRSQEQTPPGNDELSRMHSTESQDSTSQNIHGQASQIVKRESSTDGTSVNEIQQQPETGLGSSTTLIKEGTYDSNHDIAETSHRSNESKSLTIDAYSENTHTPGENSESDIFNINPEGTPLKTYIVTALAVLGTIVLFSLLLKYKYLGVLFSEKKKKGRKEIESELHNILYGAPYVGERNNYISYGHIIYE